MASELNAFSPAGARGYADRLDFKLAFRGAERKTSTSTMEQNIAESHHLLSAWAWVDKNRKQVIMGVSAAVVVGLVIGYASWSRAAKEEEAGEALSQAVFNGTARAGAADPGAQLLKLAADNTGTKSGAQALLLAAGALFNSGKYAEAQSAFDQFARDNTGSPLVAQALYGSGAALAAQGKLAEAAQAYKSVGDRFPSSPVATQARYSQAAALAAQANYAEAVALYEEVSRASASSSPRRRAEKPASTSTTRSPVRTRKPPTGTCFRISMARSSGAP